MSQTGKEILLFFMQLQEDIWVASKLSTRTTGQTEKSAMNKRKMSSFVLHKMETVRS